tara:strand:+ start:812 stop:1045 length:234 start_codon:yes stop_codon:yes gene_type:complete
MTTKDDSIQVTFAVEKNEKYGDYRVVEYFDGEWNNERDGNWQEGTATTIRDRLENALTQLNGEMSTSKNTDTVIYIA